LFFSYLLVYNVQVLRWEYCRPYTLNEEAMWSEEGEHKYR